ncbi:hypothetical protein [Kitasatospora sp. NPDC087314]|uniref:hypothetical protein n=1 Tax=Kitasatospora sp. NPDC087314 TaxID=3364068 RepID=UPI0037F938F1
MPSPPASRREAPPTADSSPSRHPAIATADQLQRLLRPGAASNKAIRQALGDLDLSRQPAGPVRATIDIRDPAGRKATYDLYDVRESIPSPATAAQLDAAAARRTISRTCEDCGAHPDAPCTPAAEEKRRGSWWRRS